MARQIGDPDEVEMIPAMIEEGLCVLEKSVRLIEPLASDDDLLIAQVFSAMFRSRQDG